MIREGAAGKTHRSMLDDYHREHMGFILGWVKGKGKSRHRQYTNQYRVAPRFCWIHALVLYLNASHRCNGTHVGIVFKFVSVTCKEKLGNDVFHPVILIIGDIER